MATKPHASVPNSEKKKLKQRPLNINVLKFGRKKCCTEAVRPDQTELYSLYSLVSIHHSYKARARLWYICICCNRLMYRKTVIQFKLTKYSEAPGDFTAPASPGNKQWICKTFVHALERGKLPAQAKANHLHVEDAPPELLDLNQPAARLISLRIPLMKMVAFPCGKYLVIHGPAVNVPTDLTPVCTFLPRLPSQIQMIPMKLKRKLCYKGHQYVRPAKVLAALQWLKLNNPLYKDIEINSDWLKLVMLHRMIVISGRHSQHSIIHHHRHWQGHRKYLYKQSLEVLVHCGSIHLNVYQCKYWSTKWTGQIHHLYWKSRSVTTTEMVTVSWEIKCRCLGDHIAVQGLADILHVYRYPNHSIQTWILSMYNLSIHWVLAFLQAGGQALCLPGICHCDVVSCFSEPQFVQFDTFLMWPVGCGCLLPVLKVVQPPPVGCVYTPCSRLGLCWSKHTCDWCFLGFLWP